MTTFKIGDLVNILPCSDIIALPGACVSTDGWVNFINPLRSIPSDSCYYGWENGVVMNTQRIVSERTVHVLFDAPSILTWSFPVEVIYLATQGAPGSLAISSPLSSELPVCPICGLSPLVLTYFASTNREQGVCKSCGFRQYR